MIKKTLLQISTVVLFVLFAVMMSSCERYDTVEPSVENNSEYAHLYNTEYIKTGINNLNLSVQDLKQMHKSIASIYQVRSELKKDWSKRKQYVLDPKIFANKYIQKYMKMYLYEYARVNSPLEKDYEEPLPYIKNLTLDVNNIVWKNELLLVPFVIKNRKNNMFDSNEERYMVFKKTDQGEYKVANFLQGYLVYFESEVLDKVKSYTKEDWESNTIYNPNARSVYMRSGANSEDQLYLEFITNDIPREKYREFMDADEEKDEDSEAYMERLQTRSNNTTYNRDKAVEYALRWTDDSGGWSSDSYNPDYRSFPLDCANFISQCLKAGGFTYDYYGNNSCLYWFYRYNDCPQTWTTANGLKRYLYDCGQYTTVVGVDDLWKGKKIKKGDPFFIANIPEAGKAPVYHHSMIVTDIKDGWDVRYAAHSVNRKNYSIHRFTKDFWFNQKWTRGFHITTLNN